MIPTLEYRSGRDCRYITMISVGGRKGYLLGYLRTVSISFRSNRLTIGIPDVVTSRTIGPYFWLNSIKKRILWKIWDLESKENNHHHKLRAVLKACTFADKISIWFLGMVSDEVLEYPKSSSFSTAFSSWLRWFSYKNISISPNYNS